MPPPPRAHVGRTHGAGQATDDEHIQKSTAVQANVVVPGISHRPDISRRTRASPRTDARLRATEIVRPATSVARCHQPDPVGTLGPPELLERLRPVGHGKRTAK